MFSIFDRRLAKSAARLDSEIMRWFATSRAFKTRSREGFIIVVDSNDDLYMFLKGLSGDNVMCVELVRVDSVQRARALVESMDPRDVKAVAINSNMLDLPCNGNSLPSWLEDNYPQIPVWIFGCRREEVSEYQKVSMSVGVLELGESRTMLASSLGLKPA